jgi:hypothetical protein
VGDPSGEELVRVIIESPYAGRGDTPEERDADAAQNLAYLRAAMRDSLLRGEAPYASHGLYTQEGVLRDDVSEERAHGIHAGFLWREVSEKTVVYADRGLTKGMQYGIEHARQIGHPVEFRYIMNEKGDASR